MAIPATGRVIGTQASMSARLDPQTEAIEDEPLQVSVSDTTRIKYGKSIRLGSTDSSAFSANRPCPTSRRHTPRSGLTSPTE
jgi:hypothetical protein